MQSGHDSAAQSWMNAVLRRRSKHGHIAHTNFLHAVHVASVKSAATSMTLRFLVAIADSVALLVTMA